MIGSTLVESSPPIFPRLSPQPHGFPSPRHARHGDDVGAQGFAGQLGDDLPRSIAGQFVGQD